MYQAGIKNIRLYENNGISFVYFDPNNDNSIADLASTGTIIPVLNYQLPNFDIKLSIGKSGELLYKYNIKFTLFEYSISNLDLIETLKRSIYGWCFDIEYYDGTHKYYNTPLVCKNSDIKPQDEMVFNLEFENPALSNVRHLDYYPNQSIVPIYRADTTILTADTTIYTADYAL